MNKGDIRWPKISVVTPTYNCAQYLRRCIESVLAQNYPNFEHIIIDGASKDETLAILKKYPHLRWISEPDSGEAEALNKGLRMVTGEIVGWLNADDRYIEDTFYKVVEEMRLAEGMDLIYGKTIFIDEKESPTHWVIPTVPINLVTLTRWFHLNLFQPSIFFSKRLLQNVGDFREDLKYGVDYEYWFRVAAKGYRFHFIDQVLSKAMIYRSGGKTEAPYAVKAQEWLEICEDYLKLIAPGERVHFWKDYYIFRLRNAETYYKDVPLPFPDKREALIGLLLAQKELTGIYLDFCYQLCWKSRHPDQSDLLGLFGETLLQNGLKAEAKKAFEWALSLESRDPEKFKKFATNITHKESLAKG